MRMRPRFSWLAAAVFLFVGTVPLGAGSYPFIFCLTVDPSSPDRVFVGAAEFNEVPTFPPPLTYETVTGALFVTTDSGLHWNRNAAGLYPEITSLAIDPHDSSTLFATADYLAQTYVDGGTIEVGAVFKSTDGGLDWQNVFEVENAPGSVFIDPVNSSIVYASATTAVVVGDLFKTTDGGETWTDMTADLDVLSRASMTLMAIDPKYPSTLFAGVTGGLIKSTDGGATWSHADTGLSPPPASLAIDPSNTQTLYAGGYPPEGGIFKSENGGASWSPANGGLPQTGVYGLLVVPESPSTIYAATAAGLFKSIDGGTDWDPIGPSVESSFTSIVAAANDSTTLYAATATDGVFRSLDSGATWRAASSGIGFDRGAAVIAAAIPPRIASIPGR